MASFGHIAVGMAAGRAWDREMPLRPMIAFSALAMLPDLDVLGFHFHVPYFSTWGHRGAIHSIFAALVFATIATFASQDPRKPKLWLFCAVVAVSHGLLDAMTDGGYGVALLWPLTSRRYFLPWTPIPVAPIGAGMLTFEGARVVSIELLQFSPLAVWALWPRKTRRSTAGAAPPARRPSSRNAP
jgi:inner membrane protein